MPALAPPHPPASSPLRQFSTFFESERRGVSFNYLPQRGRNEDFCFFTLPLEIPDKAKLLPPGNSSKLCFHGNFTSFHGNFTSFLTNLWTFYMLFLWYSWKFHILKLLYPPPVWFFSGIAQYPKNMEQKKGEEKKRFWKGGGECWVKVWVP